MKEKREQQMRRRAPQRTEKSEKNEKTTGVKKTETTPAALREKLERIEAILRELYPEAACALRYEGDPWRLLVLGRLSAQCTDARVNLVSVPLFRRYPDASSMAKADLPELEGYIRSCGLFHTKARDLRDASRKLVAEYGGVLPSGMEELLAFPGVGRKIANLLRGDIFGLPAVVADTHCIRLCGRFGFTPPEKRDPVLTERVMTPLLTGLDSPGFCHRIVLFGRQVCTASSPRCDKCPIRLEGLCAAISGPGNRETMKAEGKNKYRNQKRTRTGQRAEETETAVSEQEKPANTPGQGVLWKK